VFFAYGDVDFKRLVRRVEEGIVSEECGMWNVEGEYSAADISHSTVNVSSENNISHSTFLIPHSTKQLTTPNTIERSLNTHQAHVMIGTRAYDIHHPLRIPLYLLNNILGGPGMNARLNISLRERNALVYTVESTTVSYSDTGIWCIYFGCDPHDIRRCLKLVRRELDKMAQKPLSDTQLRNAKRQLKGQIAIACDNREQFALDFGKSFLHYGWEKDITHLYDSIDNVKAEDIQKVANELFATDVLTTLIYK
jgi:predicted Zn-dependent peptidase